MATVYNIKEIFWENIERKFVLGKHNGNFSHPCITSKAKNYIFHPFYAAVHVKQQLEFFFCALELMFKVT